MSFGQNLAKENGARVLAARLRGLDIGSSVIRSSATSLASCCRSAPRRRAEQSYDVILHS